MKKRLFCLLIITLYLASLTSCVFATTGESLEAFSRRMNELNESYNMTSEGYILDTQKCELTKFFKLSENEIMLNFKYDKKYRLTDMNIVFDSVVLEESPHAFTFVKDCIRCFVHDEKSIQTILENTDFDNTIVTTDIKTTSAETDNIKMEIDTTNLGTVITIYKDLV